MSRRFKIVFAILLLLILPPILAVLIYPLYRAPGSYVLEALGIPALRPYKPSELSSIKFGENGITAWNDATRISYGVFPVAAAVVPCRITAMRHPAIDHKYVVAVIDTTSGSLKSTTGGYALTGTDEIRLSIGTPLSDFSGSVLVDLIPTTDRVVILKGPEVQFFLQNGLRDEDIEALRKLIGDGKK